MGREALAAVHSGASDTSSEITSGLRSARSQRRVLGVVEMRRKLTFKATEAGAKARMMLV